MHFFLDIKIHRDLNRDSQKYKNMEITHITDFIAGLFCELTSQLLKLGIHARELQILNLLQCNTKKENESKTI